MSISVCVFTLGCKVNQYESDSIVAALKAKGYIVTTKLEYSEIYIINTCAVTSEAEKKSRQVVSKIVKLNQNAKIYIMGCASQNDSASFENKQNVVYITGTAKKQTIIDELDKIGVNMSELPSLYEQELVSTDASRTRAYVKIQDGCNNFCSYCIIPYLRGRSRSRDIDNIKKEIQLLVDRGIKEIVITGINISDYGKKDGNSLSKLLGELKDINVRLRLGSLEEGIIDEDLMKNLKSLKQFCPQFHLSLQSGCDKVLKEMNRKYTTAQYFESVNLVRKYFSDAAITTDIICGYPTETEADFLETLSFVNKVKFSDIHIFMYSRRTGTAAAKLPQISGEIIKNRADNLNAIKMQLKNQFAMENLGKNKTVLIETLENGLWTGYTENYLKVYLDGNFKENQLYNVQPYEIYKDGVLAKLI